MRTSQEIDKIADALAKAQGEMKNPEKNQTAKIPTKAGGSYQYNYADLPHTLDTIRVSLAKHGLSHTSGVDAHQEGVVLFVRLMHTSGQWLESNFGLPHSGDPKSAAANITYFRRYLLTALVGVAADDDLDSEPEAPQAKYQDRRKPAQLDTSSALKPPAIPNQQGQEKKPVFDSESSSSVTVSQYSSWETAKLESYMAEMLGKLKARNMSASDLKGESKIKFDQVQQELTKRGNQ